MTQKIAISKPGYNVLTTTNPANLIFSSDYNTLKYYASGNISITIDAGAGDIAGHNTITHSLGYHPYVELYVDVYIGSPSGIYLYCPFTGAGTTVFYKATYSITTSVIDLYAEISGWSTDIWHFYFKYFIFRNDLGL